MPASPETLDRAVAMVEDGRAPVEVCALMNVDRKQLERARWPEKYAARDLCIAAVRNGDLFRPSECEDCGEYEMEIQAHHHDYSKPFDVEWLCPRCHGLRHSDGSRGGFADRPLTALEKKAIWAVSAARQIDQADLLTDQTVQEVVDAYCGWVGLNTEEKRAAFCRKLDAAREKTPRITRTATAEDVADHLGVNIQSVWAWARENGSDRPTLPHKRSGRRVFFNLEEAKRWAVVHASIPAAA